MKKNSNQQAPKKAQHVSANAPISEGKKEVEKQFTFTIDVRELTMKRHKAKDLLSNRIGIDKRYMEVVALIAECSKVGMAQIINNIVGLFLDNEYVAKELRGYCIAYQKKRLTSLINEQLRLSTRK